MITIPGTLTVNTCQITSHKKGLLESSIGQFNVKCDQLDQLDQLDDGQYKGHFDIAYIGLVHQQHQSSIYFDLEISISNIALSLIGKTAQPFAVNKINKMMSNNNPQEVKVQKDLLLEQSEIEATNEVITEDDKESNDKKLFGSLWPLDYRVQLDSTVDRDTLQLQMNRLRQLQYLPNKEEQAWYKAA